MKAGTRVHHKYQTWMIGTIHGIIGGNVTVVKWDNSPVEKYTFESIDCLRAAPVQPTES